MTETFRTLQSVTHAEKQYVEPKDRPTLNFTVRIQEPPGLASVVENKYVDSVHSTACWMFNNHFAFESALTRRISDIAHRSNGYAEVTFKLSKPLIEFKLTTLKWHINSILEQLEKRFTCRWQWSFVTEPLLPTILFNSIDCKFFSRLIHLNLAGELYNDRHSIMIDRADYFEQFPSLVTFSATTVDFALASTLSVVELKLPPTLRRFAVINCMFHNNRVTPSAKRGQNDTRVIFSGSGLELINVVHPSLMWRPPAVKFLPFDPYMKVSNLTTLRLPIEAFGRFSTFRNASGTYVAMPHLAHLDVCVSPTALTKPNLLAVSWAHMCALIAGCPKGCLDAMRITFPSSVQNDFTVLYGALSAMVEIIFKKYMVFDFLVVRKGLKLDAPHIVITAFSHFMRANVVKLTATADCTTYADRLEPSNLLITNKIRHVSDAKWDSLCDHAVERYGAYNPLMFGGGINSLCRSYGHCFKMVEDFPELAHNLSFSDSELSEEELTLDRELEVSPPVYTSLDDPMLVVPESPFVV
jgi:hypothetical protein